MSEINQDTPETTAPAAVAETSKASKTPIESISSLDFDWDSVGNRRPSYRNRGPASQFPAGGAPTKPA